MSKSSPPFISALAHHPADPFRLLVESVVDYAIYMVDPARLIASWNPGAERIYGYRADEIIGQPFSTFFTPADLAAGRPEELWQFALASGHHEYECVRVRKDHSEFRAVVTVSALKDHFGIHAGFSVVTRDITERKRAEDAVRQERDLSGAILASLPGIYYMYDENRRFLRWNSRFEVVSGYSAEEIGGLHPLDLFDPADRQRVGERIAAVFENGRCEVEADFVAKDGRRTPYYFNGVRTVIAGQRCLLGMGIDITSQTQARDELRRTSDLLQAVVEGTPDALFVKDLSGKYLLFNTAASHFVGKPAHEVLGRDDRVLFGRDGARIVMEHDQRVIALNQADTKEEELTASGVTRTYLATKTPFRDATGRVVGLLGISRDITDRKRAEVALVTRNNLYAMLSRTNRAVNRCTTPDQLYRELCQIAVEVGRFQFAWVGVPDANRVTCVASAGTDHGYMDSLVVTLDERDVRSHGPTGRAAVTGQSYVVNDFSSSAMTRPWHESANRVGFAASAAFPLNEGGRVVSILTLYADRTGFFTDELQATLSEITPSVSSALDGFVRERERKRAEERLEQNRALLRVASRIGRMGAWAVELEGLKVIWSEDLLAMLELPADHSPDFEYGIRIYRQDHQPLVREAFAECVRNGTPFDLEVQCRTAAGRPLWVRILGEAVRNGVGVITGAQGAFQDITDRRQSAEILQLRDRAIQAVSQGILISDPNQADNPVIFASEGFTRMTGYRPDEVVGRNCRFLQGKDTDPDTVRELREAVLTARSCAVEILNYRKDGKSFWNQLTITPVLGPAGELTHFVGVQTDVTERRRLEAQFRQAQKMEAVGQLAGGVAHDFNNLLTIINGYSDLLLGRLRPDDPTRAMLSEIYQAGERAGALTRQLLAFSRQQVLEPKVLHLNDIVRHSEKMLRRLIGENILLTTSCEPNLGQVKADPGQIEQVLMNLVVNARDAIPKTGNITIETQCVRLDESYCRGTPDLTPGDYVLLAVSDTGVGMDEATRARIFEPFFTTKELGKGTGLGLATVHGIVKQSRGHIAVYSEVGRGTTFKVYLPQLADSPDRDRPDVASRAMPPGTETVLLVEDEDAVRELATHVLRECGYQVLAASNGKDAVRVAEAESGPIHLMVSDVVMPHLGGADLATRVVARHPECRVLFVSGYTNDAVLRHGILEGEYAFLQKPFAPSALAQKVRQVLDTSPPPGGPLVPPQGSRQVAGA